MFTQSFNHLNPVNRQLDHKGNIVRVNNLEKKILSAMTSFILLTSLASGREQSETSSNFMEEKLSCNHYILTITILKIITWHEVLSIENSSWKVQAYGIYAQVVDVKILFLNFSLCQTPQFRFYSTFFQWF